MAGTITSATFLLFSWSPLKALSAYLRHRPNPYTRLSAAHNAVIVNIGSGTLLQSNSAVLMPTNAHFQALQCVRQSSDRVRGPKTNLVPNPSQTPHASSLCTHKSLLKSSTFSLLIFAMLCCVSLSIFHTAPVSLLPFCRLSPPAPHHHRSLHWQKSIYTSGISNDNSGKSWIISELWLKNEKSSEKHQKISTSNFPLHEIAL